jgi:tight adherence protein C
LILVALISVFAAPSLSAGAGFSLAAGVLGFLAPNFWLRSRANARKAEIRRELPDMLDMLTISVEAGLGFDAALAKYVKNGTGPLSEEFSRALQEIQAGVTRRETLRRLGHRAEVPDLTSFISAMVQADILGTSVAHVLRTQSTEMRLRRRQRAEEAAQKLPVKLVFPVVLCILPATIIAIMGPAVVRLIGLFGG